MLKTRTFLAFESLPFCLSFPLTASAFRSFLADPTDPHSILCGTEPGRAFRSGDDGLSWQELAGIAAIPNSTDWYLPYSPRAGGLGNFYSPPNQPQTLFASLEVGGLLPRWWGNVEQNGISR